MMKYDERRRYTNPDGVTAFGYTGEGVVPPNVNKVLFHRVITEVDGRDTFDACKYTLQSVVLNDGLEKIGCEVFMGCMSLKEVNLPSTLIGIGCGAFEGCTLLESIFCLPLTLTEIGANAFKGTRLTDITLPATLTKISDGAFMDCRKLETVTMHEGLQKIGEDAFSGCKSLTSIHFPSTLNRGWQWCIQ